MNVSETLLQLAKFAETGEEFQLVGYTGTFRISNPASLGWAKLQMKVMGDWNSQNIDFDFMVTHTIRSIPKLPKLTDEEKEFLKWFPQDWYISKDDYNVYLNSEKPKKCSSHWFEGGERYGLNMPTFPKFDGIKWSDEDCYTIGELRE